MDQARFDRITRTMAQGTSRRHLLRRLGGGLAGGVLAALGLGPTVAVQAQEEGTCPECRQCIADFFGRCVETCVQTFPANRESCALACCEGSLSTCTVLGECTPTCSATCPGGQAS